MKIKTVPLGGVKAGPDDGLEDGEFIVYPSTFTRVPDAYGDVVKRGAFADTIQQWKASGDTLPGLYGHRMDDPDFFVAGASDMGEDEHGWWVRGVFDLDSPKGPQVYRLVKGRRLRQLSFAYDVRDEGKVELDGDTTANELRKVDVHEFSFVPVGANQDTSVVAIKALTESIKAGRIPATNRSALTEALDLLDQASVGLKNVLAATDGGEASNDEKAKDTGPANDEDPTRGKSEEPSRPSPADLSALLSIELADAS